MDFTTSMKIIKGRITYNRYKRLQSYSRKHSQSLNCGHDWDCCGCVCRTNMEVIINPSQTKLSILYTVNRNY